jgi:Family of unknown function (DUF5947)
MSQHTPISDSHDHHVVPLGALRRLMRENRERTPPRSVVERCEFCGTTLANEHRHVLNLSTHEVLCACNACALLFGTEGSGGGKYKVISSRYRSLKDFQMSDEQWDELMIPVNMMYMVYKTTAQRMMAFYPGPAGAMESLLELEQWDTMVEQNPVLHDMEADIEALLINRVRNANEYYIVPIDECYRLVGLIRSHWKGLSGGQEVWKMIDEFFMRLRSMASAISMTNNSVPSAQVPGSARGAGNA